MEFPAGISIPANGYLIVWADEDGSQGPLHASFKLSAAGETLSLVDTQGYYLDNVIFDQQTTDMGYARVPNGTGPFVIQEPTFGAFNGTVATFEPGSLADNAILVAPKPCERSIEYQTFRRKNRRSNHRDRCHWPHCFGFRSPTFANPPGC
jgi:hypothetical protein